MVDVKYNQKNIILEMTAYPWLIPSVSRTRTTPRKSLEFNVQCSIKVRHLHCLYHKGALSETPLNTRPFVREFIIDVECIYSNMTVICRDKNCTRPSSCHKDIVLAHSTQPRLSKAVKRHRYCCTWSQKWNPEIILQRHIDGPSTVGVIFGLHFSLSS